MEAREQQYKQAAEEMAVKFKEKLGRQKEKTERLVESLNALQAEHDELQAKLAEAQGDYSKVFEQLENSKLFGSVGKAGNLSMNLSIIDEKLTSLEADRSSLLKELVAVINESGLDAIDVAELEDSDMTKSATLDKLRMVLANCSEDKR